MSDTHYTAPSYRPCGLCSPPRGCDYAHLSTPERPCWGEVIVAEDFGAEGQLHACEGHTWTFNGTEYTPEPPAATP